MADGDFIPDDFDIEAGTWGTNAVLDKTVFVSADASIKFPSAQAAAVKITTLPKPLLVSPGDVVVGDWIIAQGNITAGNQLVCEIFWLDSALAWVATNFIFLDELPAVIGAAPYNFYRISGSATCPVGATNAVLGFERAAVGFDAWIDAMGIRKVQPGFRAVLSADATYTSGSTIVFDTEDFDFGSNYNPATGLFTAPETGVYAFGAGASVYHMNAGGWAILKLYVNGAAYIQGAICFVVTINDNAQPSLSVPYLNLNRGDTVEVVVSHGYGAARTVTGGTAFRYTWFSGGRIN
jgi:hypothetical protein